MVDDVPPKQDIRFAVICASNQNRSMEAHKVLKEAGFNVSSFGTGSSVKLPGPSADQPNIYVFGTPYKDIYEDLSSKDKDLYTNNGLLSMLERNIKIKVAPQRWQDQYDHFDIIFTFEGRVFDSLVADISNRRNPTRLVHAFNLEVKDNHEESQIAAKLMLELARLLNKAEDWENEIDGIVEEFEDRFGRELLHSALFF